MFIFVVDAYLIVQNGVKAYIAKISYLFYRAQVITVAFSQRQDCATRSEHLLPKMWEWRCGRICTNFYLFLGHGVDGHKVRSVESDYVPIPKTMEGCIGLARDMEFDGSYWWTSAMGGSCILGAEKI